MEREANEQGLPPDERQRLREQRSFPVIRSFQQWIVETYSKVLPMSKFWKALLYAAIIYLIFSIYKKCGVNPHDYLTDIITRIDNTKISRLEELLLQNWK